MIICGIQQLWCEVTKHIGQEIRLDLIVMKKELPYSVK